jgi:hypothetical protein
VDHHYHHWNIVEEEEMIIASHPLHIFEAKFGSPLTGMNISNIRIRLDEMREWSWEYGKKPEDQWKYIWNEVMPKLLPGAKMVFIKPPKVWHKKEAPLATDEELSTPIDGWATIEKLEND